MTWIEWDWGSFVIWTTAMVATWVAMHIIFRYEVGAEKAEEVRKEKSLFKRLLYIGYAKYVKEKPIAFFILRWQFYLGIVAMLVFPLECKGNFLRVTDIYSYIAMGMLAVAALASWGVDNSKDRNGELAEVVDTRVAWNRSWEKLQQIQREWNEKAKQLDRQEQIRLLKKLESKAHSAEEHWREYYPKCKPDCIELMERNLQQLRDIFYMIDRQRCELNEGRESCFITADALFPCDAPFCENYERAKKALHQADTEKQADCLAEMLEETCCYLDDMTDRWFANEEIGREICDGLKESRERIFAQLDEIEAYQKQIQVPGLEDDLKEIYHNMHLNGILPPEREGHFPDAIHQGEIHRFYDYD